MKITDLMTTIVHEPFKRQFKDPDYVRVCNLCSGEVVTITNYDESLDRCTECESIEPGTHEISIEEWESR